MLDSGEFATINEVAERESIAPSYMTRVLRLALLAPDIIEAILEGRPGTAVLLARILESVPAAWLQQRETFVGCRDTPFRVGQRRLYNI